MDHTDVLRCSLCKKPFDKPSTLKRHGYYCRSRKSGHSARSRSCIPCAKRKTRCDGKQPSCSVCSTKVIECYYPVSIRSSIRPNDGSHESVLVNEQEGTSASDPHQNARQDDVLINDSTQSISDPDFATLEDFFVDWRDSSTDVATFFNNCTNGDHFQPPSPSLQAFGDNALSPSIKRVHVQQNVHFSDASIPRMPTDYVRSLAQRPKTKSGTQRIASLMFHNLKSYPLTMLRHGTLPPFIHPQLMASGTLSAYMEPMTNCISLIHMISHNVRGSRKLFWKNVQLECERFQSEHSEWNEWELLAAMQALSVYTLIRLLEGETSHNNLDHLLLLTVTAIAKQLTYSESSCNTSSVSSSYGTTTSWERWILRESIWRLCVIYQIVNMLVYFDPAALCQLQTDLVLAPLPASKRVWEAPNEAIWKVESEKVGEAETFFGLAANGELVKLNKDQLCRSGAVVSYETLEFQSLPGSSDHWAEWCSGMDELGGLIMLVASLTT